MRMRSRTPSDPPATHRILRARAPATHRILRARGRTFLATLALCAALPGTALGATTTISAAFTPDRLGASATVSLGFQIKTSAGHVPPPLTEVDFHYPVNLGLATTGLGVASCQPAELQAHGASICPPDSRMGSGSARVEVPVGGSVETETASLALVAGPSPDGYVRLLLAATGLSPVIARIVIPSLLQPGAFKLAVPLVESLPEAADVSVVRARLTIGGNLTYYEPVHGRNVAYRPAGIGIPRSCPRGGFPFSASFAFQNGGHATARTTVACPRRARARP
jgi:hypothetical protein